MNKPLVIIYYIYINPNMDWKTIVEYQLTEIYKSQILAESLLNIELCCEFLDCVERAEDVIQGFFIGKENVEYNLNILHENNYEYQGIKKLYDCAIDNPEKVYIYIHSKGMVFKRMDVNKSNIVSLENQLLTTKTLNNWRETLELFQFDSNINKAAIIPSDENHCWYNFFWASGKYIKTCEEPIKHTKEENRWYYEYWLGSGDKSEGCSYNLLQKNCETYNHKCAVDYMHCLIYNLEYFHN